MLLQYLCSFLLVAVTLVLADHEPIVDSQSPGKEIIEESEILTGKRGYQGNNVVLNEVDRSKTRQERSMLAIEQPPVSNIYRLSHFGKVDEEFQTKHISELSQSEVNDFFADLLRIFENIYPESDLKEVSESDLKEVSESDLKEVSESDLNEVSEPEVSVIPKKKTREFVVFPATPLILPSAMRKPIEKESSEEKTEVDAPSTDHKPPVDVSSADQDLPVESRTDENAQDDVKDPLSAGSIRGIPGVHFPDYEEIPMSSFECTDKQYFPGFYADMETGCQVFHVCYQERRESFLCPVGTIFNQAILTCDNWYSSNCSFTPSFYSSNAGIGVPVDETTPDSHYPHENDQSTVSTEGSSTQGPTTESYYPGEPPSEGEGEYYHFGGIHPLHSKRISPEKFFELFTRFFPVKVKVTVFPVTNETKITAVASVGDRKNKHPTQQPGKTPHPTRPRRPRPTRRPYPTRRTPPTKRHYPKTTTTRKTYTTTTRKPYTTTTTHKPYTTTTTYKPHTTTTRKPYTTTTTYKPHTTTTRKPYTTTTTYKPRTTTTRKPYTTTTTYKPRTTTTRKPYTTTTTYKPRTTTTQKPYKPPTTRRPHTTTTRRPYSTTRRPYYPPTRGPYQRDIDPSVNKHISDAFEIARRILEHVGHMYPRGDGSYHPSEGSYPNESSSSYPNEGSSYPNEGSSYPSEGSSYPSEGSSYPSESSSYPSQGSSRSCPCVDSRGNPSWCSCTIESDPIRWCRCYDKHGNMRRCPCSVNPRWCPCVDSYGRRTRCPCRYPRGEDVPPNSDHLSGEKNCTETAPGHDHGQDVDYGGYKKAEDDSSYEGLRVRSYKPLVQLNPRFIVKPVYV